MIVKLKRSFLNRFAASACVLAVVGAVASCNKKTETTEEIYMPESSVAVTGFSLKSKAGSKVKLDSVFFSIDLYNKVIFNADSLPVGTDVSRLAATITYPSSVSEVIVKQSGGKTEGEIDYKANPSDSIDFSGRVQLTVTAEDGASKGVYDIKVNIHKVEPDSLMWDQLAVTPMPSRLEHPKDQKTVGYKSTTYTLIEESDGTFTLAVADDLIAGEWTKTVPVLDFRPEVRTMRATPSSLFVLDEAGVLHSSADGIIWENTGEIWVNTIGAYGDALLGMKNDGSVLVHTSWPSGSGFAETPVARDFPVSEISDMVLFSNRWTTLPIGIMVGGRLADGTPTDRTWGFDGDHWAVLSEGMTPPVAGATLVPYYVYRKTNSSLVQTEFSVWMLIGGELDNGESNRRIYVSYDNGINWYPADTQMQLPDHFPGLRNLDGIMAEWPKQASLTDNWSSRASRTMAPMARIKYSVSDYEVYWDCPYIYIFGGINELGSLNNQIWRGVLNRLTFVPLF